MDEKTYSVMSRYLGILGLGLLVLLVHDHEEV